MHILHRNEELDRTQNEDFVVKRERRSKRKAQFRTQLHGGGMELESTEGSTSSVAVVGTGEAIMSLDNPIVYNRYYLMISTNLIKGVVMKFVFIVTTSPL